MIVCPFVWDPHISESGRQVCLPLSFLCLPLVVSFLYPFARLYFQFFNISYVENRSCCCFNLYALHDQWACIHYFCISSPSIFHDIIDLFSFCYWFLWVLYMLRNLGICYQRYHRYYTIIWFAVCLLAIMWYFWQSA